MPAANQQIHLAARPKGFPKPSDFRLVKGAIPEPADGQFLVGISYLSVDPYMRGRMNAARSYAEPQKLDEVMGGGAVGKVLASRHRDFAEGEYVSGFFGWQQYALSDGAGVTKVDPRVAPISTALGVLGMPGLTAYFGLLDICAPRAGETVVVSGAAGAVGSTAGQIARIAGCRVVGIAGSDDKIRWITRDLGFDAGLNYKTESLDRLKELCPNGIDCYFDNVGGATSDAIFPLMNTKGRASVCGQISLYNLAEPELGARLLPFVLVRTLTVKGFLVFQYAERYSEGLAQLTHWFQEGKLKYRETVADGIENAVAAFLGMLRGENVGKQLVRISELGVGS
ncbi:MAG TPA: NADP-dependent oxidoreductase [Bryobacteraceae bacterium]|nr:NADP-dependent oxidoreductase [Bryobacteraceae bacterium]